MKIFERYIVSVNFFFKLNKRDIFLQTLNIFFVYRRLYSSRILASMSRWRHQEQSHSIFRQLSIYLYVYIFVRQYTYPYVAIYLLFIFKVADPDGEPFDIQEAYYLSNFFPQNKYYSQSIYIFVCQYTRIPIHMSLSIST